MWYYDALSTAALACTSHLEPLLHHVYSSASSIASLALLSLGPFLQATAFASPACLQWRYVDVLRNTFRSFHKGYVCLYFDVVSNQYLFLIGGLTATAASSRSTRKSTE